MSRAFEAVISLASCRFLCAQISIHEQLQLGPWKYRKNVKLMADLSSHGAVITGQLSR